MKTLKNLAVLAALILAAAPARAQLYSGMDGLLHVPSATIAENGLLRAGVHVLSENFAVSGYEPQTVPTYYISLTPYEWVQASFMGTAWRREDIYYPDRTVSLKIRPLKEGKWWPSIAIGTQDPIGTGFYTNYYVAAAKHFHVLGGLWGINAAYRYYRKEVNAKWTGVVGGITFQPDFYRDLRIVGEWNGSEVDLGADARLFGFLRVQLILQDFRYFSGGICVEFKNL